MIQIQKIEAPEGGAPLLQRRSPKIETAERRPNYR